MEVQAPEILHLLLEHMEPGQPLPVNAQWYTPLIFVCKQLNHAPVGVGEYRFQKLRFR